MAIEPHNSKSNTAELLEKLTELINGLDNIDHETLRNLLGGIENEHYHLTDDEYQKLKKIISKLFSSGSSEVVIDVETVTDHEQLTNLKGGNKDGHYHLTNEELQKIIKLLGLLVPTLEAEYPTINHEKLNNLLGGTNAGHYHLTKDQLDWLILLASQLLDSTKRHLEVSHENDLTDLLGGASTGHWHLTRAQLTKIEGMSGEEWTFTLEDNSTVTKKVALLT